jgi:hypothetical protein
MRCAYGRHSPNIAQLQHSLRLWPFLHESLCNPHRGWAYFQARLAFTMAAFNVLVQWHGFQPTASGFVPLSIAEFSL